MAADRQFTMWAPNDHIQQYLRGHWRPESVCSYVITSYSKQIITVKVEMYQVEMYQVEMNHYVLS